MHKILTKSIKSKLSFSFIIVTCTVFLVYAVTYPLILNMFAKELEAHVSDRMQSALLRLDDSLSNIQKQIFSLNNNLEFKTIFTQDGSGEYQKVVLWSKVTQTLRDLNYVKAYSLIIKGNNEVITGEGILAFDKYFNQFWNNPDYNSDFWKKELYQPFYIRYYPQAVFTSRVFGDNGRSQAVIPIAFKNSFNTKYMIIAFVDIQAICRNISPDILENLSVYHEGEALITGESGQLADYEEYLNGREIAVKTQGDSFFVICRSSFNNFYYVKSTSIKEVRSGLNQAYLFSLCIVFAALLISACVIAVITKRLAQPFISIEEMLKVKHLTNDKNINELTFIQDNLRHLFDSHEQIARELEEKNVMLQNFQYQSKLKNIYVNIQHEEDGSGNDRELSFYLLSLEVIYRSGVSELIHKTYSEISYILKEHLEMILKHHFPSLLLFQLEENSFFAKVGLGGMENSIADIMDKIKKQLEIEEEYCYFLVAVSSPIKDEALIAEDYYDILELQQQFCLMESSQVLYQDQNPAKRAYTGLNIQQSEDLKKLVISSDRAGAINLISNMLDIGITPKTTRFYANLFCGNIMNILFQVISEKYISLPAELPVQSFYHRLSKCSGEKDFREAVLAFAGDVLDYVWKNSGAEDPLILGVKSYVAENYDTEFTMEMMAERLKISKSYLSTCFKSKTGINLIDYIQQYRVQKAIELMKRSNIRLSDIGNQVGITNPNSFIRTFKKHTGITPSEYRKNLNI